MTEKVVKQAKFYAAILGLIECADIITPERVKEDANLVMKWATEVLDKEDDNA
jgi:hypothetical protein